MSAHLYIEGGGNSKEENIRCRRAFTTLLASQGFSGRLPRLTACGGRGSAYDDFLTAHSNACWGHFVALLIDSEDPVDIPEDPQQQQTWVHLKHRDGWERPAGATDQQVLLMTTCMETWIAADRATLRVHYGADLNENQLPPTTNLECRHRHDVQDRLERATAATTKPYRKGKRSFDLLAKLNPKAMDPLLPSFRRAMVILAEKL